MKVNLTKIYSWLSLIVILLLIVEACRKDYHARQENDGSDANNTLLDIKSAGLYYKQLESSQNDLIRVLSDTKTTTSSLKIKYALFSKAYASQTESASFVEIPILYNRRASMVLNYGKILTKEQEVEVFRGTLTRLLIYKSKRSGKLNQKILTYIPDIDYLHSRHGDISSNMINKLDADFSGIIEYSNFDGAPLVMFVIKNKLIVKKISLNKEHQKQYEGNMLKRTNGTLKTNGMYLCDWDNEPVYAMDCEVGENPSDYGADCTEYIDHYEPVPVYCDDTPTGDDCSLYGINCPGDDTPEPGGGTPGSGGGNTTERLTVNPLNTPPCITSLLSDISSAGFMKAQFASLIQYPGSISLPGGDDSQGVAALINKVFSSSYGITFTVGSGYPGTNAVTDPQALYPAAVELQQSYVSTATALSVVRSVLHETMHAGFVYALSNSQIDPYFSNLQAMNSVLFDTNGNPQADQNLAQHNAMALNYVNGLANMLASYANSRGISSPDPNRDINAYCKDLAWVGLFNTNAYKSLPPADTLRIHDTGLAEQNKLPGSTSKKACP